MNAEVAMLADLPTRWAISLPIAAALLGGMLGFGSNYLLKRRDERFEARAAVRLIDAELGRAEVELDKLPDWRAIGFDRKRPEAEEDRLAALLDEMLLSVHLDNAVGVVSDEAWKQTRLLLARHLDFSEWDKLRAAYLLMAAWAARDRSNRDHELELQRIVVDAIGAEEMLPAIRTARAVAQRHAKMPPVQTPAPQKAEIRPPAPRPASGDQPN